jgi:flagellar protein FliO/FliZ
MPQGAFTSLLWFIAIVAMIPLVLWLLKRTPLAAASGAPGVMRTVAALPIGPGQRVVTIEVGQGAERRWLVLGVTPQHIATLHTLAPHGEPHTPGPAAAVPFGEWLSRMKRGPGAGDAA